MKTLRTAAVLWALLPPCAALAADWPAPPSASSQFGGCPLAQAPQAEPPAAAAPPAAPPAVKPAVKPTVKPAVKPRRKINIEILFDPCHMVDAERIYDEAPTDAVSPQQRLDLYQDVMESNRRQNGAAQPETWWRLAAPSGTDQDMPAVPEPQGYPMWLAGLALLALAARRRIQRR